MVKCGCCGAEGTTRKGCSCQGGKSHICHKKAEANDKSNEGVPGLWKDWVMRRSGAELHPKGRERPADEVEEDQYKDWPRTKEGHCILPAAPNGLRSDEGIDDERRDKAVLDKKGTLRDKKPRDKEVLDEEGKPNGKGKGQQKCRYKNVHKAQTSGPSASTASTTMQPPGPQAHIGMIGLPEPDDGYDGDHIGMIGLPELDDGCNGDRMPLEQEGCTTADGSKGTWILVDSGAACHVCPRDWMSQADTCVQAGRDLKTVSGDSMQHYGRRTVRMKFDGSEGHGAAAFEVTDVQYPILSSGALMKSGHTVVFSPTNPYILRPTGEQIALEMRNGQSLIHI